MGQLLSRDIGGEPGSASTNQTSEAGVLSADAAKQSQHDCSH